MTDFKVNNVCLVFCQAMLKRQFQRKFENMQSGQSGKQKNIQIAACQGRGLKEVVNKFA